MIKSLTAVALALAIAAPAAALSVPYTTGTSSFTGLGDTIGSPYDQITLHGVSGTVTRSGTYLVNNVDFTVGVNATRGAVTTGFFTDTAAAFGMPFTYTVPYTLTVSSSDSITLGGNTFVVDGHKVTLNTLTFTNQPVGTISGALTATISVPEPATWAMMVAGFGLVGLGVRRRRATTVAA